MGDVQTVFEEPWFAENSGRSECLPEVVTRGAKTVDSQSCAWWFVEEEAGGDAVGFIQLLHPASGKFGRQRKGVGKPFCGEQLRVGNDVGAELNPASTVCWERGRGGALSGLIELQAAEAAEDSVDESGPAIAVE
jgi:hypothetical protein